MLARTHKNKDCDGAIDPRAIDLLEAMAMDPAAEHIYRVGHIQQRRRRAVQYIPARMPTQHPVGFVDAIIVGPSAENNAESNRRGRRATPTPDTQTHCPTRVESAKLARSMPSTGDSTAQTVTPSGVNDPEASDTHESADNSDEELYLRRVSVLYHELWSGDWIEHQAVSAGLPNSVHGVFAERETETELEPEAKLKPEPTTDEDSRPNTDTTNGEGNALQEFDPIALATEAATAEAKITTATMPHTILDTIAQADNGCADSNSFDKTSSSNCFPELQGSWASLVDTYVDSSGSVAPVPRDRAVPVTGFSPSDLADALVGTVRRLEDDHTLLQHKRWSVVKELAITEAHYLRDLLVLRAVFYEPLAEPAGCAALRAEDAQTIFGNLGQVIDCARSLVEYLTVAAVYEANRCYALDDEESRSSNSGGDGSGPDAAHMPATEHNADKGRPETATSRRRCGSRPASQPEAVHFAKAGEQALRNSAWADISIAQAFLLTSQRMERVYAQYCQNFEAASRRIIELKRLATTTSAGAAVYATAPTTPMATHHPLSASSPFADHMRGWRQMPTGHSSPAHSSMAEYGGNFGDVTGDSVQTDTSNPEAAYAVAVQQLVTEQAQLLAGKTTSWDLPSLLIKPVQRILKYPLLIRSLLGLTPTHTLDHNRLEKAAQSVERIAETINAVNNTNGLRISTATTPSLSASNYDSQGRITRELRRVLRRKPGNESHVRTKSHTESFVKDRLRMSVKIKHRVREPHDRMWSAAAGTAVPTPLPSSGTEALIEQHETRIVELVRALRLWESDIGTMLSQQRALAARWQDLYASIDSNPEPAVDIEAKMHTPSLLSSTRRSGDACFSDRVGGRGSNDLSRCFQQQWQLVPDLSLPVPGQGGRSESNKLPQSGLKAFDDSTDAKLSWEAHRRDRATQYRAALDAIYASVFPTVVCGPLQNTVYPVLHSLRQVYSDGPRYILSEISRASSVSSSTAASTADLDSDRLAKLQHALAEDLPKLFEHERTVVRLVLERVARIQHQFYTQVVEHLSGATSAKHSDAAPANPAESKVGSEVESMPVHTVASRPSTSGRMLHRTRAAAQYTKRTSVPNSSKLIKASFDRRLIERASPSYGAVHPSASECTSQIRSGLWLLAQEAQRHSPAQSVVKPRHRRSTIEHADSSDTVSDNSTSFDEYSSVSVFELASGVENESPAIAGARSAWSIPAESRPGDTAMYPDAADQRSVSSRHVRKKSSGFIDRIASFKPGKMIRGHPSSTLLPNRATDGSSMDSIKSRPQLGLGIGVSGESPPPVPPIERVRSRSQSALRTKSDADLHSAAMGWSEDVLKFEPLPVVDPIRFSKGFIDATFELLGAQDRSVEEPPANELSEGQLAPTTPANGE